MEITLVGKKTATRHHGIEKQQKSRSATGQLERCNKRTSQAPLLSYMVYGLNLGWGGSIGD